jgi:hypothetical protein
VTLSWHQHQFKQGLVPPGRAYHTSTLIDNRIFIFGGRAGNKYFNDLYALNVGM